MAASAFSVALEPLEDSSMPCTFLFRLVSITSLKLSVLHSAKCGGKAPALTCLSRYSEVNLEGLKGLWRKIDHLIVCYQSTSGLLGLWLWHVPGMGQWVKSFQRWLKSALVCGVNTLLAPWHVTRPELSWTWFLAVTQRNKLQEKSQSGYHLNMPHPRQ